MKRLFRSRATKPSGRRGGAPTDARIISDFMPPEGVPLKFQVAGLGARFGAQIADILLALMAVGCVIILLVFAIPSSDELIGGLAALLFFAVRTPYYILTELLWNGATLGKRMLGIQVVSADGRALSAHAVVVRNLMKEAEVFAPAVALIALSAMEAWEVILSIIWIIVVLAVPLFNRKRRRIGDMIAGTYVIQRPRSVLMPDLAAAPPAAARERFAFQPHQLDHYGAYELQTLEKILHGGEAASSNATTDNAKRREATLQAVIDRIRAKIDYAEVVKADDAEDFLRAFYNAQRAHLEQRRLFGDQRDDKFHQEEKAE